MTVKGNHPLAEIIARKLFSIETVPSKEQKIMVSRAIKSAVKYYEAEFKTAVEAEREACAILVEDIDVYALDYIRGVLDRCSIAIRARSNE